MNCSAMETLTEKIMGALPPSLQNLSTEMRSLIRDTVKEQLLKLDLVPREEFDKQCIVLHRTQQKLIELEKLLQDMEEKLRNVAL